MPKLFQLCFVYLGTTGTLPQLCPPIVFGSLERSEVFGFCVHFWRRSTSDEQDVANGICDQVHGLIGLLDGDTIGILALAQSTDSMEQVVFSGMAFQRLMVA